MTLLNDELRLTCIKNIAYNEKLRRYTNIVLVHPLFLNDLATEYENKSIGKYPVIAYRGNDFETNGFLSRASSKSSYERSLKPCELSIILPEKDPISSHSLRECMTDLQRFLRWMEDYPQITAVSKDDYDKGASGLRSNISGRELDLTEEETNRIMDEILEI